MCCKGDEGKPMTGIAKDRSCTDILWLLAFIMSWVGTVWILLQAQADGGDVDKALHGMNLDDGKICSIDTDAQYTAWPSLQSYEHNICVTDCSYTDAGGSNSAMASKYESEAFATYCLPSADVELSGDFADAYDGATETAKRASADVYTARWMIFASVWISLLVAFLYNIFMRHCTGVIVWGMLLLMLVAGIVGGAAFFDAAKTAEDDGKSDDTVNAYYLGASIMFFLCFAFVVVICFLRKSIAIGIGVIKEATRALGDIKMMVFFPLGPLAISVLYFVWWIYSALYLYSIADKETAPMAEILKVYDYTYGADEGNPTSHTGADMYVYTFSDTTKVYGVYHFFHLLWNVQFFFYFTYFVLAGTVADWYFTRRDEDGDKKVGMGEGELSYAPITASLCRTIRYHLGTIALTSLILAIVHFLQVVIHYIEKKVTGENPNKLQKAIFCCIKCCLACAECCLDKISKNAMIYTAIWGDGFFFAACNSFQLLLGHVAEVVSINVVSTFMLLIGKVSVSLVTSAICGLIFIYSDYYSTELTSPVAPTLVVFFIAFTVAYMVFLVFEVAIDTVFLCFLVDLDHNKGGQMFASDELRELVGNQDKSNKVAPGDKKTADDPDAVIPLSQE